MNNTQRTYLIERWMKNLPRSSKETDAEYFARLLERMQNAGVIPVVLEAYSA